MKEFKYHVASHVQTLLALLGPEWAVVLGARQLAAQEGEGVVGVEACLA